MRVFPGNQAKSFPGMGQVIDYEEGWGYKMGGDGKFYFSKLSWQVDRRVLAMLKGGRGIAKGFL